MKKKDLMVIGVILVIAGILMGFRGLYRQKMTEDMVIIQLDGQEYARIPLTKPQQVTIGQPGGETNIVEISEDGAVMLFSTCENQLCIHQGKVTRENMDYRPNQGFIICLPNRVSVELQTGGSQ